MFEAMRKRCPCGGGSSSQGGERNKKSEEIDAQLKRDVKQSRTEVKMLLLGAGESGKSTILKQMKLIHEGGYNVQELRGFRAIVYNNVAQSAKMLVNAMDQLGLSYEDPENEANKQLVLDLPEQVGAEHFSEPMVRAIKAIWADQGIQECFKRAGRDFYLIDSARYFLDNLDRVGQPNYIPDDQDVLRCRVKTTGITETVFNIGELTYRMYDVGGQRSERKKWIHCFENVTAIIFMVAISEYDQKLVEDDAVNRMQEALTLFDSICNSRWFNKTSIILFLNKIDVFKDKIEDVPIEDFFPDFQGGPDFEAGCEYFKERFEQLNMSETKQIYTHYTCATDTNQIRFVMAAVNDIIIQNSLRQAGLM
jgi:guanine nucleotide-binding protein G(i) subunit alpha